MIQEIASDDVIQQAYDWLCGRRVDYSANNDVWHVRYHWGTIKPQLQAKLLAGDYRFSPVQRIRGEDTTIERFRARMTRLYEQGADADRIGESACRWWRWVHAGVSEMTGVLDRGVEAAWVALPCHLLDLLGCGLPFHIPKPRKSLDSRKRQPMQIGQEPREGRAEVRCFTGR